MFIGVSRRVHYQPSPTAWYAWRAAKWCARMFIIAVFTLVLLHSLWL